VQGIVRAAGWPWQASMSAAKAGRMEGIAQLPAFNFVAATGVQTRPVSSRVPCMSHIMHEQGQCLGEVC
jgi:maltose-binding protein MalE